MLEMPMTRLKQAARFLFDAKAFHARNAMLLTSYAIGRHANRHAGYSDADHLAQAAAWLARAQDASADGGVAGRWRLGQGWTSSYPETTGYLIPTFLELAGLGGNDFADRAHRAVQFLLSVQLANGAFPAGEIADNRTRPSVFNSAQIICGLSAWHTATGDARAADAACRAADWIIEQQDADGAWRKFVYNDLPCTYHAHAACWVAQLGASLDIRRFREAALRHLRWVLSHVDRRSGWIDLAGFEFRHHAAREAFTHSIAYTLCGTLLIAEILGQEDAVAAVERASWAIARRLELDGRLSGVLNHEWKSCAPYSCVTGTAQMALIWFRLYRIGGDPRFVSAALNAIDTIKDAQRMRGVPFGALGGIPGSDPPWGDYIRGAFPNWAVKFFVDALIEKRRVLSLLRSARPVATSVGDLEADAVPSAEVAAGAPPRVVLYSSVNSTKIVQFLSSWSRWQFVPTAILVERVAASGLVSRIAEKLTRDGPGAIFLAMRRRVGNGHNRPAAGSPLPASPPEASWRALCAHLGIPVHEVASVNDPQAVSLVRNLQPDFAIHAGAGLLRKEILAVPRFGTLNAHMGLLPQFRGMNVAEWSALLGHPTGVTVHFIDPGIDTGPIIARRNVDTRGCRSISDLRTIIDNAQVELLGEVVQLICNSPERPLSARVQSAGDGRQYFRMHHELKSILEERLAGRQDPQLRQRTEEEADEGFKDREQREQRHPDALPEEVQDAPAKIDGGIGSALLCERGQRRRFL
jgi:folate-dependent phosphoribosylglycinamide formyltransferase PurN